MGTEFFPFENSNFLKNLLSKSHKQAPGTRGAGGARAPPRIEILYSKNFQNWQNFIFLLFGPPLGKNRSQGPVDHHGIKEICIFHPIAEKWGKI